MISRAIVLGNSITLRNWLPQPGAATIIATNLTWAVMDPDVICCTQRSLDMPDRPIYHTTEWTSSGVWAMAWAYQQGYDQIWLLSMEGTLVDQMQRRTVLPGRSGGKAMSQHWTQDLRWLMHTQPQIFSRLRPIVTAQNMRDFQAWSGWQRQEISDHAEQMHLDEMTADPVE